MTLGYVCTGVDMLDYAATLGFDGVEMCGFEGTSLDPVKATDQEVLSAREEMKKRNVQALSYHYGIDYAAAFGRDIKKTVSSFARAMQICKTLGTSILSVNCWFDPGEPANADAYVKALYSELGDLAQQNGIWIAIENCPHSGHNYVDSPDTMRRFLELVDKERVGFELDPSHMVWLGCDYLGALRDFRSKVYAIHAKDTEVIEPVLRRVGIRGRNWWRYRMPGWGSVDWKAFITELLIGKYDGPVIIEHEDPVFDGEYREQGLRKGKDFLSALIL